ncbi:MAG: Mth938-like domain-containing protein [Pseudomonadota bacterium]
MDVTPLVKAGQQIIQSYADGHFRISGKIYDSAVIVLPDSVQKWTFSGGVSELSEDDFAPLIDVADSIDVVLLGCGPQIQFLSHPLRNALKDKGLSVDVMDTGAACRTYNVLMAEGRRVAAALLPF